MKITAISHPDKKEKRLFYAFVECEDCGYVPEEAELCSYGDGQGTPYVVGECNNCWTPTREQIEFVLEDSYKSISRVEFARWLAKHDREVAKAACDELVALIKGENE